MKCYRQRVEMEKKSSRLYVHITQNLTKCVMFGVILDMAAILEKLVTIGFNIAFYIF